MMPGPQLIAAAYLDPVQKKLGIPLHRASRYKHAIQPLCHL